MQLKQMNITDLNVELLDFVCAKYVEAHFTWILVVVFDNVLL